MPLSHFDPLVSEWFANRHYYGCGIMGLGKPAGMKAIEFEGKLIGQDSIRIPDSISHELPTDSTVRVILLWENEEDSAWRALGTAGFAGAYAPEDDVYEELLNGPSSR